MSLVYDSGAELEKTRVATFSDVSADEYYSPYVAWAAENRIVSGVGDNRFAPDKAVTREEMAVILDNYTKYEKMELTSVNNNSEFADNGSISGWAKASVAQMQKTGLVNGKPGNTYKPEVTATRAEVAMI